MAWVADFLTAHRRVRFDFVLSDAKADLIADRIDVAFRGGPLQDSGYIGRQMLVSVAMAWWPAPSTLQPAVCRYPYKTW